MRISIGGRVAVMQNIKDVIDKVYTRDLYFRD